MCSLIARASVVSAYFLSWHWPAAL